MDCPLELFDKPADLIYCERVERIWRAVNIEKLTTWELKFINDLYWNPNEKYSEKQKQVINRLMEKLGLQ